MRLVKTLEQNLGQILLESFYRFLEKIGFYDTYNVQPELCSSKLSLMLPLLLPPLLLAAAAVHAWKFYVAAHTPRTKDCWVTSKEKRARNCIPHVGKVYPCFESNSDLYRHYRLHRIACFYPWASSIFEAGMAPTKVRRPQLDQARS